MAIGPEPWIERGDGRRNRCGRGTKTYVQNESQGDRHGEIE